MVKRKKSPFARSRQKHLLLGIRFEVEVLPRFSQSYVRHDEFRVLIDSLLQ